MSLRLGVNQRKRRGKCSRQWFFSSNNQWWVLKCSTWWFFFKRLREDFFRDSSLRMGHKVFIMVLFFWPIKESFIENRSLPVSYRVCPLLMKTQWKLLFVYDSLWHVGYCQFTNMSQRRPKMDREGDFLREEFSACDCFINSQALFELFFHLQTWLIGVAVGVIS